jgi:hypothetical protein
VTKFNSVNVTGTWCTWENFFKITT